MDGSRAAVGLGAGGDAVDRIPLRLAGADDVPAICRLLVFLHGELRHAPLDAARMEAVVTEVVQSGAVLLSLAADGRIAGTMGLVCDQPWFSRAWVVRDLWLYVHAAERREPHARALLRAARAYAGALRTALIVEVAPGAVGEIERGSRVAAKIRLYSRELGEPTGATWSVSPQPARET